VLPVGRVADVNLVNDDKVRLAVGPTTLLAQTLPRCGLAQSLVQLLCENARVTDADRVFEWLSERAGNNSLSSARRQHSYYAVDVARPQRGNLVADALLVRTQRARRALAGNGHDLPFFWAGPAKPCPELTLVQLCNTLSSMRQPTITKAQILYIGTGYMLTRGIELVSQVNGNEAVLWARQGNLLTDEDKRWVQENYYALLGLRLFRGCGPLDFGPTLPGVQ